MSCCVIIHHSWNSTYYWSWIIRQNFADTVYSISNKNIVSTCRCCKVKAIYCQIITTSFMTYWQRKISYNYFVTKYCISMSNWLAIYRILYNDIVISWSTTSKDAINRSTIDCNDTKLIFFFAILHQIYISCTWIEI